MSYIGYFRSLHTDILYSVNLKKEGDTTAPKEIMLAGTNPFVVRYDTNDTPFEPIRNSTATISIVSDNYFEDILPDKAHDTQVVLKNEDTQELVWVGYLTPKVYDQGYVEEVETVELEASDVISSLQYMDYETINEGKEIVTFNKIIGKIISNTLLQGFYWSKTKMIDGEYVLPENLKISEQNFFSNDTDEPWKCNEVIEEMCKYIGMTAIQKGEWLYFVDYNALSNSDSFTFVKHPKATDYQNSTLITSGEKKIIDGDDVMETGTNISFEPVYNKFVVKDNFYKCEDFITNIFDDEYLENRGEHFYSSFQVAVREPYKQSYRYKKKKWVEEEESDNDYVYFHRLYDHKDYESVYRMPDTLSEVGDMGALMNTDAIMKNYVGATITDFGRAKKTYYDDNGNKVVANQLDWERCICINQKGKGWGGAYGGYTPTDDMVVFRLKPKKSNIKLHNDSYLIIDYKLMYERYEGRNYINPDWDTDGINAEAYGYSSHLAFRLGIGGKYWNGKSWQDEPTHFIIDMVNSMEYNKDMDVVNEVSWDLYINETGYKIPLMGLDTTGDVVFEIFLPNFMWVSALADDRFQWNQYCWVKDFKIKVARPNKNEEDENDIVYENIIDELNVSEMSEIDMKFTTSVEGVAPSYSNVIYRTDFVDTMTESGLDTSAMKPEENIIQKYYNQYSTPTKKITYTLDTSFGPFDKYYGLDIDNPNAGYVVLGCEIDYSRDKQEITFIEKK